MSFLIHSSFYPWLITFFINKKIKLFKKFFSNKHLSKKSSSNFANRYRIDVNKCTFKIQNVRFVTYHI